MPRAVLVKEMAMVQDIVKDFGKSQKIAIIINYTKKISKHINRWLESLTGVNNKTAYLVTMYSPEN